MSPLPATITDAELIAFLDQWGALLAQEDYEAACAMTAPYSAKLACTADNIREAVKRHGQRVTLNGVPNDGMELTKEVTRWPTKSDGSCGDVWYDLYVDGQDTDLTALFLLRPTDGGLTVHLIDVGVR